MEITSEKVVGFHNRFLQTSYWVDILSNTADLLLYSDEVIIHYWRIKQRLLISILFYEGTER
jgi:hypothetical protein